MGNQTDAKTLKRRERSLRKKSARRKAARLLAEQAMQHVRAMSRQASEAARAPYAETYVRCGMVQDRLVITHRAALLGNPAALPVVLTSVDLVGLLENPIEFTDLVARLGLTTLAALVGRSLGGDATAADLAARLVSWAKIDVEAIRRAAEVDTQETPPDETDTTTASEDLGGEG